jgi:hypothetical protein
MNVVDDALPELKTTTASLKRDAPTSDNVAVSNSTKSGRWKASGRMSNSNTTKMKRMACMSTNPSVKHAAPPMQDIPQMTGVDEVQVPSRREQLALKFDALRSMDLAASHRIQAMFPPSPQQACPKDVTSIMEIVHSHIKQSQILEKMGGGCIASVGEEETMMLHSVFGDPAILPELFEYMQLELEMGTQTQLTTQRFDYVYILAIATSRYMGNCNMTATMAQASTLAGVLGHSMLMGSMRGGKVCLHN